MQVCLPLLYNTMHVLLSFLQLSGGPESSTAMRAHSANHIASDEYVKLTPSLLNMH